MAYPETFSVFSDIPEGFPETYSEITDPYLIWNFDIRTLTYYPSSSNNSQATTFEEIINSEDGTKWIDFPNNNAKIFLQVEDNLRAIPRVEGQNDKGFFIVLYDGEYFEEDKVKLDCSQNPIKVNVLIIQ